MVSVKVGSANPRPRRWAIQALALCLLAAGTGCSSIDGSGRVAQLNSEDACAVAISVLDCRLAHAKAGGYPITPSFEAN